MRTRTLTHIALMSSLLVLSAWISIPLPFTPVPITLQSLVIMVMALIFPLKVSLSAYALYLVLGSLGLPVFANYRAGFDVLIGPSGGYLLGFFFAITWLALSKTSLRLQVLIAQVIIYLFGLSWLAIILKISWSSALLIGLYPYLIGDGLKLLIVYSLIKKRTLQRYARSVL